MAKREPRRQQAPFKQELNGSLFDHVAFEVIGPLCTSVNGNSFILTMNDYFSKWAKAYEFRVRDEILFRAGKEVTDEWRLVIPRDICKEILSLLHSSNTAGHPGMSWMNLTVCSRFYWPRMRKDIENWIKCCRSCTMAKRGPRWQRAPFQQEISGSMFDGVAFDVIGPLPMTANGNRFILKVIGYFSKWAEAVSLICELPIMGSR